MGVRHRDSRCDIAPPHRPHAAENSRSSDRGNERGCELTPREVFNRAAFRGARIERRSRYHVLVRLGRRRTTIPTFGDVVPRPNVQRIQGDLRIDLARPIRLSERKHTRKRPETRGPTIRATPGVHPAALVAREGRWWIVTIRGVRGCHTYGSSLREAERRLRDLTVLWRLDGPVADPMLRVPSEHRTTIADAVRARRRADEASKRARALTRTAARQLVDAGYSRRDAATLLAISHQRVQQLLDGG